MGNVEKLLCRDPRARSGRRQLRGRVPSPAGPRMGLHDGGAHGCERHRRPATRPARDRRQPHESISRMARRYLHSRPAARGVAPRPEPAERDGTECGRSTPGVYVISDYAAAAGHRGQLRQVLDKNAMDTPGRSITLTHVQGAPWTFLVITRFTRGSSLPKKRRKPGRRTPRLRQAIAGWNSARTSPSITTRLRPCRPSSPVRPPGERRLGGTLRGCPSCGLLLRRALRCCGRRRTPLP